jgi:hypothetical protein
MGSWMMGNIENMTDKKKVEKEIHKAVEIMAKGYNLINMTGYN